MKNGISSSARRLFRLAGIALVYTMVAACGGDGCDMDGFRDAPFPLEHADKTVPVSAEVRVTSHGLAFMSGQVENVIGQFQDDGLSFCLPPTDASGGQICHEDTTCDDGSTGCQLDLEIEDAALVPVPNNRIQVDLVIGGLHEQLPISGLGLSCWLNLYSASGGTEVAAIIPVSVPIRFEVDPQSPFQDIRFVVEEMEANIDDVDYHLSGRGSANWLCGGASFGIQLFLDSTLRGLILDQLDGLTDDLTRAELCRPCGDGELPCPSNSVCDTGDDPPVCLYQADNECVPRLLGIEGIIEADELLGDFVGGGVEDIFMTGRVADRAVADTGLTLGVRVGTEPENYHSCVPVDLTARPSFAAIDPSPSINLDVTPEGDPFMFGFAMHRRSLQHIMWSLWAGGALCLEVGTEDVDMLTTNAIGALVPSINDVALGAAPMQIRISPQNPPDIRLGANRVGGAGDQQYVEEGLLIVDWEDLDIHMYGYALGRYVRFFTLRTDLELPIAILADAEEGLYPVLGDVEEALTNMRVLNYDILNADKDRILDLLPTLLGIALPELASALSDPFELPQFLGYQVVIGDGDLRGIDNNQYLGLFANLEFVGYDPSAYLRSDLRALVSDYRIRLDEGRALPRVSVDIDAVAMEVASQRTVESAEFSYRLNGGTWSLPMRGPKLTINDPVLRLQGVHRLEVRTREAGQGALWQRVPTSLDLIIDFEAPILDVWQGDDIISVRAEDGVDAVEHLQQRHRFIVDDVQGSWSSWADVSAIEARFWPESEDFIVEVQVRDRAGLTAEESLRVSRADLEITTGGHSDDGAVEVQGCGGCSAGGGGPGGPFAMLTVLAMLIAFRLRRRIGRVGGARAIVGLAILAFASGCGGCGDDTAGTTCEAECAAYESCEAGECVSNACSDDDECIDGICEDDLCVGGCRVTSDCNLSCVGGQQPFCDGNQCVCEEFCPGDCEEGTFCCFQTNSCQNFPNWCSDMTCDDGFRPEITDFGDYDSETCQATEGTCECVSLPPLPLGYHGAYPSLGQGGGVMAVAVHNLRYRDLMVGILDENTYEVQEWFFVDGVPRRGQVGGAIDGPRRGIINPGDLVGTHTAMAVDDDGKIHVFYRDEDDDALKYARGQVEDGEWAFETTTVEEDDGDSAYYSAVLLRDGILHLFYTARLDASDSEIRYRAIAIDHDIEDLENTEYDVLHTGSRTATSMEDYPPIAGLYLQVVTYGEDLFLSFYDNTVQQVAWMISDGDQWGAAQFLDEEAGPYASVRPDTSDNIHVAYMQPWPPALIYQVVDGVREEIVSGVRHTATGTSQGPIGHDVQLMVYGNGSVEVLFYDASTHELIRAVRDTSWALETIDGEAGVRSAAHGLFVRALSLPGGGRLVMDFAIDTRDEDNIWGRPVFRRLD